MVAASLRVIGVGRTMAWTQRRTVRRSCAHEAATVEALARALMRSERHSPFPGTCLSRSLALQFLLARRGITSILRLGGRLVDGRLEAHAWVEYAGAVMGSPPDLATRFTTFDPVPSASPPRMVARNGLP